jgi:tetratricopeptide (TPR) repeat protein
VVFNGNPRHLIEWTPGLPGGSEEQERPRELRVLARGGLFAFFVDEEWVAELADDTLAQGRIGFAGQNYEDSPRAALYLEQLELESRPLEVERRYYQWVRLLAPEPERRARLASTFFDMGRYTEAAVQLLEARRQRAPEPAEALMLARSYRQLRDYPAALESAEQALARQPDWEAALLEKANVLFLSNDYLGCRDFILSILPRFPRDAQLRHLLGNCWYALGNFDEALASYGEAVALAPEAPVYRVNVGRTLERLGREREALSGYLEAAPQLFREGRHDELSLLIARARALSPLPEEAQGLDALEGRMLYEEGRHAEAEEIFRRLLAGQCGDSAVAYLYALILIQRGERARGEGFLEQATRLEPGFSLYWFRLAENRLLSGRDLGDALERALSLSPEDPWINNLAGQRALQQERPEEALSFLQRARDSAPAEADICVNLAEALRRLGRIEEACGVLDRGLQAAGERIAAVPRIGDPAAVQEARAAAAQAAARLYNQRGNCRALQGEHSQAYADYERALELDPDNRDYLENCAACCLELDLILRAEELLNGLLEGRETPSLLNLAGNLAAVQRQFERARLAYLEGLKLDPAHLELNLNLLSLYLELGEEAQARQLLATLLARVPVPPRALELERRLREKFDSRLRCDGCGREWWVPRQPPPQPAFTLRGEPPAEAPAGRCEACGRLYCIGCAAPHVREGRLYCPGCGERLRLKEEALKYLVLQHVSKE